VIYIPVPILIEQGDFDRVQAKLARSNPKTTHHASSMARHCLRGLRSARPVAPVTRTGTTKRRLCRAIILLVLR
jgi:hypothetical protein